MEQSTQEQTTEATTTSTETVVDKAVQALRGLGVTKVVLLIGDGDEDAQIAWGFNAAEVMGQCDLMKAHVLQRAQDMRRRPAITEADTKTEGATDAN